MCQLMGMNANVPTDVMFSFDGLARRAAEHKDGFGIAFFEDKGLRTLVDHHSARESPVAEMVRRYPIKSDNVIAHIRKATQGRVALENTHPFVRELWGRYWVFAHNGDLKNFRPRLHAAIAELTITLAELLPQPSAHGAFNLLLSNGQALWAHCSTRLHWIERAHPFGHAQLADDDVTIDFAAHTTPDDRVAAIATEPMTCNERWQPMAPGELRVFVGGRAVH
jgi:predicted glutamine amidotransferase